MIEINCFCRFDRNVLRLMKRTNNIPNHDAHAVAVIFAENHIFIA